MTQEPRKPATVAELVEALAAIEHERWSHWQKYLHSKCTVNDDGSLTIPADLVVRWSEQMSTSYAGLAADERESDRDQVRRYLPLVEQFVKDRGWI